MANNEGFAYAYGWNVYYQKLGLWPRKGEAPIEQRIAWVWAFLIVVFIWLPQFTGLIIVWGDLNSNVDCLSVNIPIGIAAVKILVLQCQRKATGSILVSITDDWTREQTTKEIEIMMETARLSRFISIFSMSLSIGANLNYVVSQLWATIYRQNDAQIETQLTNGLIFEGYFPFNTTRLSIFVPLWIGQFIGSFLAIVSYAGPDCLVSMMVLHLCGQLRIVRHSLESLVNETTLREPKKYWRKIADIVERHEQLNQMSLKLKDTFSSILLVQMVACSITFCFQSYAMFTTLMDRNDTAFPILEVTFSVLYAVYTIIHLFIYCYVGDRLFVESTSLADDFYKTAWYNLKPKEAKAFLFICHRSVVPLEVKAGKFCTFNLQLFSSIMKSSMGYLSMLMAMKERLTQ